MVFVSSERGEHSLTTRDIEVNENTIVQFQVWKPRPLMTYFSRNSQKVDHCGHTAALHLDVCVHRCVSRLMWVAQPKAPLPIQCVSSSHGTLVPRGTSWCLFVPEAPSPPHCAPPNFTLRASISLAQHTAGEGRSFTLENFISVGKDRSTKINDHKTELSH